MTKSFANGFFPQLNILSFSLIAIATLLSFGPSIINWFPYWDDWTIAGQPPSQVIQSFADCGRPQLGYLHALIIQLPSYQLWYKLSTFILNFLSALLFISLSNKLYKLSSNDSLLAALIFATLPIYQAREGFVMLQYSISIFFLVLSSLFYLKYQLKNWYYFIANCFLFIPALFIEASAPIIMLIALYELIKLLLKKTTRKRTLIFHSFIFTLPVLYIVLIRNILSPANICTGNNQILWSNLLTLPLGFIKSLAAPPLGPISIYSRLVYHESPSFILLIPIFMIVLYPFLWKKIETSKHLDKRTLLFQFTAALLMTFVAVAPFHMVGKQVGNWDWDSRFQAFLLISFPIFVIVILKSFLRQWVYRSVMIFTIATFISTNLAYRLMFLRDNLKVELLSEGFSQLDEIKNNSSFKFNDLTRAYNAMNRELRIYDYSGLFHLAFADERRVGYIHFDKVEVNHVQSVLESSYPGIYLLKNFPAHKVNTIDKCVKIEHTEKWLSLLETVKITYFGKTAEIDEFFKITVNDPVPSIKIGALDEEEAQSTIKCL